MSISWILAGAMMILVTAPEITRGVPLQVYINGYVCILTSKSVLQSSTELAHVGYLYV